MVTSGTASSARPERGELTLRKVALASALTLLLSLSTTPLVLTGPASNPSPLGSAEGYAPVATDFVYPIGQPRVAPTFDADSPNGYRITQMFNNSCDPSVGQGYYYAGQYFCGHTGVDLSNLQSGGEVRATANGVVVYAGYNSSYGVMVRIQHLLPDGSYIYSQYEHLLYNSVLVSYGQVVTMGQGIGQVGSTGFVTGPHLHFEIKSVNEDGVGYTFGNAALIVGYVDPVAYVASHMLVQPTDTPTLAPVASATPDLSASTPSGPGPRVTTPLSPSVAASDGGEHQAVLSDFYKRYHDYVTVTAEHLNVRAGSGYNYAPLNSIDKGARLGYLGITGNGWVHVALPSNVYGYVVRQWVAGAVLPAPPTVGGAYKPPFDTVLDTRYPARSGPHMHDVAVEPLQQGEQLAYLGTMGSWDKVVLPDGRITWVLNWYLHGTGTMTDLAAVVPASAPTAPAASVAGATSSGAATGGGKAAAVVKSPVVTPTIAAVVTTAPGPSMVTTVDGLRLRGGPRLAAGVIRVLPKGTRLSLHGYHTSWAAVSTSDGASGYVLATLISPASATAPSPAATSGQPASHTGTGQHAAVANKGPYLVVVVHGANVRAAPTKKAMVVISEPYHARLMLRGSQGDWVYIQTDRGVSGWMKRELTHPNTGSAAA